MNARGWTGIALILVVIMGAMWTVAAKKGWAGHVQILRALV